MPEKYERYIKESPEYQRLREDDHNSVYFQIAILLVYNIILWTICFASIPVITKYSDVLVVAVPLAVITIFCLVYCLRNIVENGRYHPENIKVGIVVEEEESNLDDFWDDNNTMMVEVDGEEVQCQKCGEEFHYSQGETVLIWCANFGWNREKFCCRFWEEENEEEIIRRNE